MYVGVTQRGAGGARRRPAPLAVEAHEPHPGPSQPAGDPLGLLDGGARRGTRLGLHRLSARDRGVDPGTRVDSRGHADRGNQSAVANHGQVPAGLRGRRRRDELRDAGQCGESLTAGGGADERHHPIAVDGRLLVAPLAGQAVDAQGRRGDDRPRIAGDRSPGGGDVAGVGGDVLPAVRRAHRTCRGPPGRRRDGGHAARADRCTGAAARRRAARRPRRPRRPRRGRWRTDRGRSPRPGWRGPGTTEGTARR